MSDETRITRPGPDGNAWVVVASTPGDTVAAVVAGALESAGIPVYTYRESAGAAIGLTVGLLGTVDILVPEAHYEDAVALLDEDEGLDELDSGAYPLDDGSTIDSPPEGR